MKSIRFDTRQVRATLDGLMTETRIPMKPQPIYHPEWGTMGFEWKHAAFTSGEFRQGMLRFAPYQPAIPLLTKPTKAGWYEVKWEPVDEWEIVWLFDGGECWGENPNDDPESVELDIVNPALTQWRVPGDIIYVRETWQYAANGTYYYKATDKPEHCPWRPSIHMPKEAARIFLRVTEVKVERLQDITEEGAISEGFTGLRCSCDGGSYACTDCYNSGWLEPPRLGFYETWNSLYGNWSDNPWVWVIKFERIDKPNDI